MAEIGEGIPTSVSCLLLLIKTQAKVSIMYRTQIKVNSVKSILCALYEVHFPWYFYEVGNVG